MPSGTCSRRMGFADTIRLLASLIVLGCSIAGGLAENAFATTKTGSRTPSACAARLASKRTLLGAVMAWQWSTPAFRGGMPGEPIWSLRWRRHSASRRLPPWPGAIATDVLYSADQFLRGWFLM